MRFDQLTGQRALIARSRRKPTTFDAPAPAESEWLHRAQGVPNLRLDKVRAIREALAAGTYDIEGKVQSLVDRFEQGPPPKPAA